MEVSRPTIERSNTLGPMAGIQEWEVERAMVNTFNYLIINTSINKKYKSSFIFFSYINNKYDIYIFI